MNALFDLPLTLRLALLFVAGLWVGGQVNRAIYRLAYHRRAIGPWSAPHADAPARRWWDFLPLLGWWTLRRESEVHGAYFWVRPLLIELSLAGGWCALYWFELKGGLYAELVALPSAAVLHAQFFSHAILIVLMAVATFIDFDEQTIPDSVALTGTLIGLLVAACLPHSLMPCLVEVDFLFTAHHLVLTSANHHLDWLDGLGGPFSWPVYLSTLTGLRYALLCLIAWYLSVIPRLWITRRGLRKAFVYMVASIVRYRSWIYPSLLLLVMLPLVFWAHIDGGDRWQAVLSALVGIVFGGGLTWTVRVIATYALKAEALGFGDVTLMAMIGAFLGWQAALLIFFLAPLAALLIAVSQFLLTGRKDIPFGPYLCLAALALVVGWNRLWTGWAENMYTLGWYLPGVTLCGLIIMGGLLWMWRLIRESLWMEDEE